MKHVSRIFVVSGLILGIAGGALFTQSAPTYAQAMLGRITALPNPPGAPQRDVFLVTFPHSHHQVPTRAVFHFRKAGGSAVAITEPVRKVNTYQYETQWAASSLGQVSLEIYTADNQLVAEAHYPVTQARTNVVGRVAVGALFIGASLWFWWRQQRFYRQPRR